jgi:hypothetical protein
MGKGRERILICMMQFLEIFCKKNPSFISLCGGDYQVEGTNKEGVECYKYLRHTVLCEKKESHRRRLLRPRVHKGIVRLLMRVKVHF